MALVLGIDMGGDEGGALHCWRWWWALALVVGVDVDGGDGHGGCVGRSGGGAGLDDCHGWRSWQ